MRILLAVLQTAWLMLVIAKRSTPFPTRRNKTWPTTRFDVTDLDLVITKIEKRTSSGGAWVRGRSTTRFGSKPWSSPSTQRAKTTNSDKPRSRSSGFKRSKPRRPFSTSTAGWIYPQRPPRFRWWSTSSDAGWRPGLGILSRNPDAIGIAAR